VSPGFVGAGRVQIVSPSYRKECDADHVICELRPWQRPDFGPDAQLIAAAPELLAALKELMALYYAGQMTLEDDNGQDPVIAGAECVIARAEGGQGSCQPTVE
jgi:hypothetical protein